MVILRWALSDSDHHCRLLPVYKPSTWSSYEDLRRHCTYVITSDANNTAILLTLPTNCDLAGILFQRQVCNLFFWHGSTTKSSSNSRSHSELIQYRFIPAEYRPHIWVKVLPALENIFYGANLSNILSAHQHTALDVLAWLPYGILHFGGPVVWAIVMFFFAAPGTVPVYARTFGFLNIAGVAVQLIFPCSPPWYENMYGLAPANYSMEGSPAGLRRIDELFGIDLYTTNFTASPLVFGAFPSLHSGNAVLEALFMSYCFPKLRPLVIGYAMWMWWATMYLSHHYAVDLVGGGIMAGIAFYIAKANFLPRVQMDKRWRWDYDYVEIGDTPSGGYEYGLTVLEHDDFRHDSSDEWTVGSSSSVSSGSRSPVDESQSSWEGDTLASQASDSELGEVVVR